MGSRSWAGATSKGGRNGFPNLSPGDAARSVPSGSKGVGTLKETQYWYRTPHSSSNLY